MNEARKNLDKEVWRQDLKDPVDLDNYYAPSVSIAPGNVIQIQKGGRVIGHTAEEWHKLVQELKTVVSDINLGKFLILCSQAPATMAWIDVSGGRIPKEEVERLNRGKEFYNTARLEAPEIAWKLMAAYREIDRLKQDLEQAKKNRGTNWKR